MPIYEFLCRSCGREFEELFRSPTEERRVRCPDCGGRRCEKQWSPFAFSVAGGSSSSSCSCGSGCGNCDGGSCGSCKSCSC